MSTTGVQLPTGKNGGGDGAAPAATGKRRKTRTAERFALIVAWILVIVVFGFAEPDTFMTTANFQTIFGSQSVLAVLTLALIPPLLAGDYDLSVGSVMGLSAMLVAVLNAQHDWPLGIAILAALAAAVIVALVNGAFIVYLGVDSLIATLGSGTVVSGLILWMSDSNTVTGVSKTLVKGVISTKLFGISLVFYYALIIGLVMWYVLEYTTLGRRLIFVGRGRTVARLSGIPVGRMRIGALIASASLAAVAGALYVGTTGAANPTSSQTFLLPAMAAAFLGATCITPGRFNPWGALVAVYFLVTGITGLQLLGASSFVQNLFYGGALLAGVGASQLIAGRVPKQTT
jgi:ribose transport system permease protein